MAETRKTWFPDYTDTYEYWGDGEFGPWSGMVIDGHVDIDEAVAFTWMILEDYGRNCSIDPPRHRWLRKVPQRDGGYLHSWSDGPGRGAKAVTEVSTPQGWSYYCELLECPWAFVRGSATTGIPVDRILDAPTPRQDPAYIYLCRAHAKRFHDREREAQRLAMEEYCKQRGLATSSPSTPGDNQ